VAVLEHEHERLASRPPAEALDEEVLEGRLPQLRVERARQVALLNRQPEHGVEQRYARNERRIDVPHRALEKAHLLELRQALVDPKEGTRDLLPHDVARVAERLTLAERNGRPAGAGAAHELGDESRLAHPGLCGEPDDAPMAGARGGEAGFEHVQLGAPPHHRELVAHGAPRAAAGAAGELERGDGRRLPGEPERRQLRPLEAVAGCAANQLRDVDLPGRCLGHQTSRQVHGVAQTNERAPERVPVGPAAEPALQVRVEHVEARRPHTLGRVGP